MNDKNLTPVLVSGVSCYEQDGTAYLKLEDVARGLGFTDTKNGVEYVRWNTVRAYLTDLKFSQEVAKDAYIPENIFYRLAMKAKNETAEKFQALVADEIIPSIRKHGAYMTPETLQAAILNPDTMIQLCQQLKAEQDKNAALTAANAALTPKGIFADAVSASKKSILVGELAKLLCQNGVQIGQNRLFVWMREHGYLIRDPKRSDYNLPTQKSMELGLFEIKETTVQHSDHISINRTPKVTGKGQVYFVNLFLTKMPELAAKTAVDCACAPVGRLVE